jgi:aminoglycoside 6-adenylyltransferase
VEDFFSDVPYVAKCLWRGDLLPAKWCLDYDMRYPFLIRLLEWRVGLDHGWDTPVGNNGKGLRRRLPPDIWAELVASYAGGALEANWESLFRTVALFRRVAVDVAARLGLSYPHELDRAVVAYAEQVRALPGAASDG